MQILEKEKNRKIRKIHRARKKVFGTKERPRVSVTQTNKNLYVQAINDIESKTITCISSLDKELNITKISKNNKQIAELLAEKFSEKLKQAKIDKIVLDKRDKNYHGVIQTFAEKLRKQGIQF